jgi:hypothetical protein
LSQPYAPITLRRQCGRELQEGGAEKKWRRRIPEVQDRESTRNRDFRRVSKLFGWRASKWGTRNQKRLAEQMVCPVDRIYLDRQLDCGMIKSIWIVGLDQVGMI